MNEILVVEKNPFFSKILVSLVEYYGYKTRSCFYPEYLTELLDDRPHGIIVVNLHEDNQELIHSLNSVADRKINIILLSDYYEKQFEAEPFYQRLYAYLIKPRGIVYLKEVLEKVVTQGDSVSMAPHLTLDYDARQQELAGDPAPNRSQKIINY